MNFKLLKGSRSRLLAGAVLILSSVLIARLFYLQIIQHDYYVSLAEEEQVKSERIAATRGEIYALNGSTPVKLTLNETVYTMFVDPAVIISSGNAKEIINTINEIAGGNVVDDFESKLTVEDSRYQIVAKRLTRTQADKIKEKDYSGVGFQSVSQRVYPEGKLASQVLGFVNADGVGNYGIEGYLNEELSGTDGRLETVTDVSDVPLTIGDDNIREAAVDGENVVLTIDRNIQAKVEEVLASALVDSDATDASAVVLDPSTGKVLAMANLPTYDPSKYYEVTDASLFNNATISTPYEPGSDIKTYTMATAIDKGVASATDTYYNTDYITIDDRTISNSTKGHTGNITFQTALTWSLNTGFVTLAQRLGNGTQITRAARDTMYEYFHDRFGLGQLTGIQLANEQAGTVISPDDADGNAVRYSNMAFGQGLDATMIQVAAGFSAIINGGNYYAPDIIAGYVDADGNYTEEETADPVRTGVVKETTSTEIKEMTHTARSAFEGIDTAGYYVGGKTGTSQVVKNGEYADDETIATYLGYGGGSIDSPEYVIMVSIHGDGKILGGSTDAMPIFTEISNWMLDYLNIQPETN